MSDGKFLGPKAVPEGRRGRRQERYDCVSWNPDLCLKMLQIRICESSFGCCVCGSGYRPCPIELDLRFNSLFRETSRKFSTAFHKGNSFRMRWSGETFSELHS